MLQRRQAGPGWLAALNVFSLFTTTIMTTIMTTTSIATTVTIGARAGVGAQPGAAGNDGGPTGGGHRAHRGDARVQTHAQACARSTRADIIPLTSLPLTPTFLHTLPDPDPMAMPCCTCPYSPGLCLQVLAGQMALALTRFTRLDSIIVKNAQEMDAVIPKKTAAKDRLK